MTGAAGTANAVDIRFRDIGQIEVDDQGQFTDIDAPGGDIRGHQNADGTVLEALQRLDTVGLALVAMDGHSRYVVAVQFPHHPVRAVLGGGKHENGLLWPLPQQPQQQVPLFGLVHLVKLLFDGVHGGGLGRYLHPHRIVENLLGQVGDFLGHGGGKQQRLPTLGQTGDDLADIVDKAHVQHPVRLVQNEGFNLFQVNVALVAQVVETARRSYQNIHTLADGLHLGHLSHAAENHGAAQGQILAVSFKVVLNLQRQFPCGRENQSPDGLMGTIGLFLEPLQNGDSKGRRFTGARLGAADEVPARQHRRNGGSLNGRRLHIAHISHRPQQGGQQL